MAMNVNRMAYSMMPIPQLIDGLSRERMEVVDQALSLHQKSFRSEFILNLLEGNAAPMEEHISKMAIFFESILNCANNSNRNPIFLQNLLNHTLNHLNLLASILEGSDCKSSLQQQKKAVQELFCFYINEFNNLLEKICKISTSSYPTTKTVEKREPELPTIKKTLPVSQVHIGSSNKIFFDSWTSRSDEEVVRGALLDRDAVAHAREVLKSRGGRTIDEVDEFFETVVHNYVTELLLNKQIDTAKDVLWNVGKDVWPTMKDICLNTKNVVIRDYLALELKSLGLLDGPELDVWKYLILVGGVVRNSNVEIVIDGMKLRILKQRDQPSENCENSCAINISMSQLLVLSTEIKSEFLIELFFETQDRTLEPMLEKESCWKFLLASDRLNDLICWVCATNESPNSHLRSGSRLESFLSKWNITEGMVDYITKAQCHSTTKDSLLDQLSRYAIYATEESTNLHKLLLREARNGQLSGVLKDKVKCLLVQFCVKYNIPELLISCETAVERGLSPWADLYLEYLDYLAQQDHKTLLKCIIQSALFFQLSASTNSWIPITYIILSSQQLSEAFQAENTLINNTPNIVVSKVDLQASLDLHPRLKSILSLHPVNSFSKDISVLQLIRDSCPFSIRYGQSLCGLFREGMEENLHHFEDQVLISQFGHHEMLDYHYYLKQCRPCFAASVLLADQVLNAGGPSRKILKKACLSAHGLAISYFSNQKVTASCIAFIEMLGGATAALRCHLAAANLILSSEDMLGDVSNYHGKLVMLLKGLCSEDHAKKAQFVIKLLQRRLKQDVLAQGLIVQLANLHQLPYPKNFLLHCAKNDDWMKFLLFCFLYNTPLAVVQTVIRQFESAPLKKHLQMYYRFQASNKSFVKKVHTETSIDESFAKASLQPEVWSQPFILLSQLDGFESLPFLDDLFEVLWLCHQAGDPHKGLLSACLNLPCPVLAVIADCYQPNSFLHFSVWLASWFPQNERAKSMMSLGKKQFMSEEVEHMIFKSIESGIGNLHSAFNIFLPVHPLVCIVNVIWSISKSISNEKAFNWLLDFHETCQKMRSEAEPEKIFPFLYDGLYILSFGHKILYKTLESSFLSAADKNYLVKVMFQTNLFLDYDGRTTDLKVLLDVMNIISMSEVQIDIKCYFFEPRKEIVRCIRDLIDVKDFRRAKSLASITGVEESFIVIAEETYNFYTWIATSGQDFKSFCLHCNNAFEDAEVEPTVAFKFFEECASKLTSHLDRWRALRSGYKWLSLCTPFNEELSVQIGRLEVEIWECCLNQDPLIFSHFLDTDLHCTPLSKLCCESLGINAPRKNQVLSFSSSGCDQNVRMIELINHTLDIGDIASACRLKSLFGISSMDLEILEVCLNMAEGEVDPHVALASLEATFSLKLHDSSSSQDQLCLCSGMTATRAEAESREYDTSGEETNPELNHANIKVSVSLVVSNAIREICKQLHHGKEIAKQLFACYQLCLCLNLSYKEVSAVKEPLKLLRIALLEDGLNYFSVVSDIMTALKLTPHDCAEFLSREIIAALSKSCTQGHARDCSMWGYSLESTFCRLLELVPDPCLLGNELMHFATRFTASDKTPTKEVLMTTVELLVRIHDCYSAGCHMEGIVHVLRSVSKLVLVLKSRSEWALMVRLLTGIQRYTEMNYIFKILKENDQFEYLLRKDSLKPAGFKAALLEWLRKECPGDPSLLKMTAAYFKMHREEAVLWEMEGRKHLQDIVRAGLQNDAQTKEELKTALQDFSHAAECYLQADMLNHAMMSCHQAELIALQLHIVSSSLDRQIQCILLLDSKTVAKLITTTLSFHQAQIVGRAYNHRIDWGAALFYHCISPGLKGEEYFSAWLAAMELTPALVQDLALRFRRSEIATREMAANMCSLLSHLQDIDIRYKIASELGFKEFVEDLLQAPEVAYLKDTVWQSGFKA